MGKRNKKRRGAVESQQPAEKAAAPKGDIRAAFASLIARVERMERAFDTNTAVFSDGIKMLEVQQTVSFRIMQDVFNGGVRVKGTVSNEDGIARAEVDVPGYIRDYLEELTRHEEAAKEAPPSTLVRDDDERPIEFGGDLT